MSLTAQIKDFSQKLGFNLIGIVPAEPSQTIDRYERWLECGYGGEMRYLERHSPLKQNVRNLLPEAKSIITLGFNYYTIDPPDSLARDSSRGQISRYAWGTDYHDIIQKKLRRVAQFIKAAAQEHVKSRVFVDSGPILEREYAQKSGIGWIGKNTNLINWQSGSWYFLAELLVSVALDYDYLPPRGDCGTCTLCIDACPTDAIISPNLLDSRLCISYLTIELKGSIPQNLRPQMGNLIFGCDICQEVCPWNSKAKPTRERGFYPRKGNLAPKLISLINMTQEEFSKRFKNSPIKRAKRKGFLRNVAVALGNWKSRTAVPALKIALNDDEPLVRAHAAWALGQINVKSAKTALRERLKVESKTEVIDEINDALCVS
ncbi:MAG: tRNA epoxyqueuosine(34) reductase QueG [Candidatus Poribacteria bacterium]|nr:tRNA epoxyqueuosine(34) reductase QueG [Candidatus Poribacteria bacterium]